jgi:uncharacterized membrane-anchored protein
MDALSREQIDRLAEDISFVKKAIEKNTSILRQIDFRSSLRLVALVCGLSVFLFCGLFHFLMKHYNGYSGIPTSIKAALFCAIALIAIVLGVLKNTGILKSARSANPGISLAHLIKEYFSSIRLFHHFLPTGLVVLFSCTYVVSTGNPRLVIPFLSIGAGLIYNSLETFLRIDEFLTISYWLIVTGCIVLVFNSISPLLALCLTLGCGMLLLSVIWYLPHKKRVED